MNFVVLYNYVSTMKDRYLRVNKQKTRIKKKMLFSTIMLWSSPIQNLSITLYNTAASKKKKNNKSSNKAIELSKEKTLLLASWLLLQATSILKLKLEELLQTL